MKWLIVNKRIFAIVIILLLSIETFAQDKSKSFWDSLFTTKKTSQEFVVESESLVERMKHKVLVLKDKAVEYYEKYSGESLEKQEALAESSVPLEREIASQEVTPAIAPNDIPSYKTEGLEQKTKEYSDIKQKLSGTQAISVRKGKAASSELRKTKSGVATFDPYEKNKKGSKVLRNIPVIDIGIEDELNASNFTLELPKVFTLQFEKIKEIPSPLVFSERDLKDYYTMSFEKSKPEQKFEEIYLSLPKDITLEKIIATNYTISNTFDFQEMSFVDISKDDISLLQGVILSEYKDKCHLSVGLLNSLKNIAEADRVLKEYHYATCLYKMGFYTEAVPLMQKLLVLNQKPYTTQVSTLILSDLKREYVKDIGSSLEKVSAENIDPKYLNEYHYYVGLSRSMNREFKGAYASAVKVDFKSEKYIEAQYLAAISEYMIGQIPQSIERQEKLLIEIEKRKNNSAIMALVKMNLGRAAYRNKQYKKAIDSYQFINKDNPLWIQALTEQGWMQILAGDAPGAIGNMHSLQIPQFKDIYKPESYAVRAIGYLNICQYGDAQKTLQHLTKIYSPWIKTIKDELKKTQYNYAFYNSVVQALKGSENKTTLPQPVIREISRHKDFLNIQEAINNKVDEEAQYSFIRGLINKDEVVARNKKAATLSRTKDLEKKIKLAAKNPEVLKNLTQIKTEKDFELLTSDYYDFEIAFIKESLNGYRAIESLARKDLQEKKEDYKSAAGKAMKARLVMMQKKLEKLMENNEFLAYEVFSGSGENIRYVASGGQVKGTSSNRESVSKDSNGKLYLWDFDGEFWADEIGNYKSSLKDNCPRAGNLQKVE